MSYTKGPWRVFSMGIDSDTQMEDFEIYHDDGKLRSQIARCFDMALCMEHGKTKANAHLIAAAPDLLEAAKQVVWKLGHNGDPNYNPGPVSITRLDATVRMLEKAIAKAEGKD